MQKLIKKISIVLVAALCTVCMAVFFTACEKLDPDTIYITVVDENGNAIDGTTFGEGWDENNHQVQIQFCSVVASEGGCAEYTADVDENGKAEFPISAVKALNENDIVVELHVINLELTDYKKEYFQYKISEIPQKITVTLEKK